MTEDSAAIIAPHFQDHDKARDFPEMRRWPGGSICPHCGLPGGAYKLQADLDNKDAKGHGRKSDSGKIRG
jgi:hypothetical protein